MAGVLLWVLSLFSFFLIYLVPGDPVTALLGSRYDPELAQALRNERALDEALWRQYIAWLSQILQGDGGFSIVSDQPVFSWVWSHLKVSLALSLLAFGYAILFLLSLSFLHAWFQNPVFKKLLFGLGTLGVAIPNFFLGMILIYFVAYRWRLFPSSGYEDISFLILPAVALGTLVGAILLRILVKSIDESLSKDFIRVARAKGLSPAKVIFKHALRAAIIPYVTLASVQFGYLIGGSVVIETLFSVPGLGFLAIRSIEARDYPVIQAIVLFTGILFVLINLGADFIYKLVDPRLSLQ